MKAPLRKYLLLGTLLVVAGAAAGRGTEVRMQAAASVCTGSDLPASFSGLQARASGTPLRIVAIGSSSTAGQGASRPELGYVGQVQRLLDSAWGQGQAEVINKGVGGDTLDREVARSTRDVYALHPDLVIVQAGTNDVFRGVTPAAFRRKLSGFVRELRAQGMDVLLVDNQYLPQQAENPAYLGMVEAMRGVAQTERVPLVSRFDMGQKLVASGVGGDDLLAADHFHPNDFMHWCTAQAVASTIEAATE